MRVATEALKICRAEDDMRGTLQSIFLIVDIQFNVPPLSLLGGSTRSGSASQIRAARLSS